MNKITQEELTKLNELRQLSSDLTYNIGIVEIHLTQAKNKKEALILEYSQVEKEFNEHTISLKNKYGEREVDTLTGELKD